VLEIEAAKKELWNCSAYEKCCPSRKGDFLNGEAALWSITAACVLFRAALGCY